ncbi:unnamed protein product [Caenorhabditis bovis]|uniref:Uncharacterized protein n=1 Tax=Caenorhabditis bovis TaxID=2654633 RepID=A0A8S1E6Z7_9PELO|nr:unnamed protein product [Caenorhabditis bovis]
MSEILVNSDDSPCSEPFENSPNAADETSPVQVSSNGVPSLDNRDAHLHWDSARPMGVEVNGSLLDEPGGASALITPAQDDVGWQNGDGSFTPAHKRRCLSPPSYEQLEKLSSPHLRQMGHVLIEPETTFSEPAEHPALGFEPAENGQSALQLDKPNHNGASTEKHNVPHVHDVDRPPLEPFEATFLQVLTEPSTTAPKSELLCQSLPQENTGLHCVNGPLSNPHNFQNCDIENCQPDIGAVQLNKTQRVQMIGQNDEQPAHFENNGEKEEEEIAHQFEEVATEPLNKQHHEENCLLGRVEPMAQVIQSDIQNPMILPAQGLYQQQVASSSEPINETFPVNLEASGTGAPIEQNENKDQGQDGHNIWHGSAPNLEPHLMPLENLEPTIQEEQTAWNLPTSSAPSEHDQNHIQSEEHKEFQQVETVQLHHHSPHHQIVYQDPVVTNEEQHIDSHLHHLTTSNTTLDQDHFPHESSLRPAMQKLLRETSNSHQNDDTSQSKNVDAENQFVQPEVRHASELMEPPERSFSQPPIQPKMDEVPELDLLSRSAPSTFLYQETAFSSQNFAELLMKMIPSRHGPIFVQNNVEMEELVENQGHVAHDIASEILQEAENVQPQTENAAECEKPAMMELGNQQDEQPIVHQVEKELIHEKLHDGGLPRVQSDNEEALQRQAEPGIDSVPIDGNEIAGYFDGQRVPGVGVDLNRPVVPQIPFDLTQREEDEMLGPDFHFGPGNSPLVPQHVPHELQGYMRPLPQAIDEPPVPPVPLSLTNGHICLCTYEPVELHGNHGTMKPSNVMRFTDGRMAVIYKPPDRMQYARRNNFYPNYLNIPDTLNDFILEEEAEVSENDGDVRNEQNQGEAVNVIGKDVNDKKEPREEEVNDHNDVIMDANHQEERSDENFEQSVGHELNREHADEVNADEQHEEAAESQLQQTAGGEADQGQAAAVAGTQQNLDVAELHNEPLQRMEHQQFVAEVLDHRRAQVAEIEPQKMQYGEKEGLLQHQVPENGSGQLLLEEAGLQRLQDQQGMMQHLDRAEVDYRRVRTPELGNLHHGRQFQLPGATLLESAILQNVQASSVQQRLAHPLEVHRPPQASEALFGERVYNRREEEQGNPQQHAGLNIHHQSFDYYRPNAWNRENNYPELTLHERGQNSQSWRNMQQHSSYGFQLAGFHNHPPADVFHHQPDHVVWSNENNSRRHQHEQQLDESNASSQQRPNIEDEIQRLFRCPQRQDRWNPDNLLHRRDFRPLQFDEPLPVDELIVIGDDDNESWNQDFGRQEENPRQESSPLNVPSQEAELQNNQENRVQNVSDYRVLHHLPENPRPNYEAALIGQPQAGEEIRRDQPSTDDNAHNAYNFLRIRTPPPPANDLLNEQLYRDALLNPQSAQDACSLYYRQRPQVPWAPMQETQFSNHHQMSMQPPPPAMGQGYQGFPLFNQNSAMENLTAPVSVEEERRQLFGLPTTPRQNEILGMPPDDVGIMSRNSRYPLIEHFIERRSFPMRRIEINSEMLNAESLNNSPCQPGEEEQGRRRQMNYLYATNRSTPGPSTSYSQRKRHPGPGLCNF